MIELVSRSLNGGEIEMTNKVDELVRRNTELIESAKSLRGVLVRFERVLANMSRLVEGGVPVVEALDRLGGPHLRPQTTEALDRFTDARHNARVAMFALGVDQGASLSDMARAFDISRQLASRLAAEDGPGTARRRRAPSRSR
ncbi:MAG TPA: hypothetical protein VLZ77_16615 [Acidimicrobiales bacterium]|nr:hypothetical protein [Acidimicrobiales bacterium]